MAAPNDVSFSGGANTTAGGGSRNQAGFSGSYQGFYGVAPVVQRASSKQATSVVSGVSTGAVSTNSLVLASLLEIMDTLAGMGLWKGAA